MILAHWKTTLATVLCAAACSEPSPAQVAPPTILRIEVANTVRYVDDTADVTKLATDPGVTSAIPVKNFRRAVFIGDIVAINGKPVKGTVIQNSRDVILRAVPTPGQAIADITGGDSIIEWAYEILNTDGSLVGSIIALGVGANINGTAPPGAPLLATQGNNAIVGGTGAFLGVRGYGGANTPMSVVARSASMTEDPANRIKNGGGKGLFVLQVIPLYRPEILATFSGPAVFHADFSPVTVAAPATAGETLIMGATGLGPTRPGVDVGQPFPLDVSQEVSSPVEVTVNGQSAQVLKKIGWPGTTDNYRVDFQVPDGMTSGTATIQLTAAWIAGAPVNIPIQ